MRRSLALVAAGMLVAAATPPASAQDAAVRAVRANGALLRGLDKISGTTTDLPLAVGGSIDFGRLTVRLGECRQPADDPESDAFAQMTITDRQAGSTAFSGWMIASSPALSALDDSRYDIWVVNCNDGTDAARPELVYEPDTTPQPEDVGEGGPAPGEVVDLGGEISDDSGVETGEEVAGDDAAADDAVAAGDASEPAEPAVTSPLVPPPRRRP